MNNEANVLEHGVFGAIRTGKNLEDPRRAHVLLLEWCLFLGKQLLRFSYYKTEPRRNSLGRIHLLYICFPSVLPHAIKEWGGKCPPGGRSSYIFDTEFLAMSRMYVFEEIIPYF